MTDYKETIGYKLAQSRDAAGWTQSELADAINAYKKKIFTTSVESVRAWEANKRVPRNDQIEIITDVLADALKLGATDRQKLRSDFLERAAITREAIAAGDVPSGDSHFGDILREKMEAAGLNESRFSDLMSQKAGKPYSFDDIYQIEHGHQEPPEEFAKLAAHAIERKPYRHNVVSHVLDQLGEDKLRMIKGCGSGTINKFKHGVVDTEKEWKILQKANTALIQAGQLDAEGSFTDGEYKGQKYVELLNAEYAQQTGKHLARNR